jgi:hypothetical protein
MREARNGQGREIVAELLAAEDPCVELAPDHVREELDAGWWTMITAPSASFTAPS